jgi:tetratricopeptide (TPR) repeat protein
LEHALAVCRGAYSPVWGPFVASALGQARVLAGRLEDGLPLLVEGVAEADAVPMMSDQALRMARFSEGCLLAGRRDEAATRAAHALDLSCRYGERGNEAYTLRLFGEIAAAAEPPEVEQAESHYRQALALADELGMRPLAAHCRLGLGTLYQKVGRADAAQTELSMAAELYRAMEMTFWLAKAEAALAGVGTE